MGHIKNHEHVSVHAACGRSRALKCNEWWTVLHHRLVARKFLMHTEKASLLGTQFVGGIISVCCRIVR